MIYKWLFELSSSFPVFNLFQYITFRSFLAFFTSFFICCFLAGFFIYRISNGQFAEPINSDGPQSHHKKKGTPTMGGMIMLLGLLAVCLLWVDLSNPLVISTMILVYGFAFIGLLDDLLKLKKYNSPSVLKNNSGTKNNSLLKELKFLKFFTYQAGIRPRWRLVIEFLLSFVVLTWLSREGYISNQLYLPFFKNAVWDMGWAYPLFGSFVITGCANAVNLTDGLDGLAVFPVMICASYPFYFSLSGRPLRASEPLPQYSFCYGCWAS